ncbi:MAG: hypothetical protein U9O97_01140, partial [Elusimicrobiota bacterium]|nr:hypothetical protein [Elusimicrobiota bacterium]
DNSGSHRIQMVFRFSPPKELVLPANLDGIRTPVREKSVKPVKSVPKPEKAEPPEEKLSDVYVEEEPVKEPVIVKPAPKPERPEPKIKKEKPEPEKPPGKPEKTEPAIIEPPIAKPVKPAPKPEKAEPPKEELSEMDAEIKRMEEEIFGAQEK